MPHKTNQNKTQTNFLSCNHDADTSHDSPLNTDTYTKISGGITSLSTLQKKRKKRKSVRGMLHSQT